MRKSSPAEAREPNPPCPPFTNNGGIRVRINLAALSLFFVYSSCSSWYAFLSGFASRENIKLSYAAGASIFLAKPIDPDRLIKNIDLTFSHEHPEITPKRYSLGELKRRTEHPGPGSGKEPPRPKSAESYTGPPAPPEAAPAPVNPNPAVPRISHPPPHSAPHPALRLPHTRQPFKKRRR